MKPDSWINEGTSMVRQLADQGLVEQAAEVARYIELGAIPVELRVHPPRPLCSVRDCTKVRGARRTCAEHAVSFFAHDWRARVAESLAREPAEIAARKAKQRERGNRLNRAWRAKGCVVRDCTNKRQDGKRWCYRHRRRFELPAPVIELRVAAWEQQGGERRAA